MTERTVDTAVDLLRDAGLRHVHNEYPFCISVTFGDRVALFGTANENWDGDLYFSTEAYERGDVGGTLHTDVRSDETCPLTIAAGIVRALIESKFAEGAEAYLMHEYNKWLDANPNVPRMSAEDAVWAIWPDNSTCPDSETIRAQMRWLIDFIERWERAIR